MLGLNGISAILAALGGGLFIVIVVASVLFGKKVDSRNAVSSLGPVTTRQVGQEVATYGSAGFWHLPGTYILVAVFFASFVLYYFVNWKYLSTLWLMR
jgi:cytochrome c oxidase subunit 1